MQIHNLGCPRIGAKRELKLSLVKYWRGELMRPAFLAEYFSVECKDHRKSFRGECTKVETSHSNMSLLDAFDEQAYSSRTFMGTF